MIFYHVCKIDDVGALLDDLQRALGVTLDNTVGQPWRDDKDTQRKLEGSKARNIASSIEQQVVQPEGKKCAMS